jgi:hypothetical protein
MILRGHEQASVVSYLSEQSSAEYQTSLNNAKFSAGYNTPQNKFPRSFRPICINFCKVYVLVNVRGLSVSLSLSLSHILLQFLSFHPRSGIFILLYCILCKSDDSYILTLEKVAK